MEYMFSSDLRSIREIMGFTQEEFANKLDVMQATLSRNEKERTHASDQLLEKVYGFAFDNGIRLGRLKEMLWSENIDSGHKLLFHGAKDRLNGEISISRSRSNNDFGQGFYTGETYDQAVSFVSGFDRSSVYFLDFDGNGLQCKEYGVDREWMLTIAYYRGTLERYADHPRIRQLAEESRRYDYIVAPIADNRMFQILDTFIEGEITDEQCKHCLAATNLGKQYVFTSDRSVRKLKVLERGYLSSSERESFKTRRREDARLGEDKVRLARITYRGKGKYIDELLR